MPLQKISLVLLLFFGFPHHLLLAQDDASLLQDFEESGTKAKKKIKGKAKSKIKKAKSDAKSKLNAEESSGTSTQGFPTPAPSTPNLFSLSQYGELKGIYAGSDVGYASGGVKGYVEGTTWNSFTNQTEQFVFDSEVNVKIIPVHLWGVYGEESLFAGLVISMMSLNGIITSSSDAFGSVSNTEQKYTGSILRFKPFAGLKFGPHRITLALDSIDESYKYKESIDIDTDQTEEEASKTTSKVYLGSIGYAISQKNLQFGIDLMEGKTPDYSNSLDDEEDDGMPIMAEAAIYLQMHLAKVHGLGLRLGYNSYKAPEDAPDYMKYSGMDLIQLKMQYQFLLSPSNYLYAGFKYFGKGTQNLALDSILLSPLGSQGFLINSGTQFAITPQVSLLGGVEMMKFSNTDDLTEDDGFADATRKSELDVFRLNFGLAANF